MSVSITFRTTGAWGSGIGTDLTASQVDTNFYNCKTAIEDLQDNPPEAISIDSISQSGNTITVHYTDASTDGPFTLPSVTLNFRGAWAISTVYAVNDIVTSGGSTYLVIYAHTSSSGSFDPGANDGLGHNYYGLLLSNPAGGLPTGGAAGQVLTKTSSTDYAATWADPETVTTIQTVSGTTHTLAAANVGRFHRCTNVLGCTVTVPENASVAIAIGSRFDFRGVAGPMTFIEQDTGVILNGREGNNNATDAQGAVASLIKIATNEWDLFGDLMQASA